MVTADLLRFSDRDQETNSEDPKARPDYRFAGGSGKREEGLRESKASATLAPEAGGSQHAGDTALRYESAFEGGLDLRRRTQRDDLDGEYDGRSRRAGSLVRA